MQYKQPKRSLVGGNQGFTIVELLIVVVVIAILAAVTIVAYNGIRDRADRAALEADVKGVTNQLEIAKIKTDEYPETLEGVQKNEKYKYIYTKTSSPETFCVTLESIKGEPFHFTNSNQQLQAGMCEGHGDAPLLSVGSNHTCAVIDSVFKCWGRNNLGQLGTGLTAVTATVPTAVDVSGVLAGKKVTKIGAGFNYTCVLADGAPYCWGTNDNGVLGDNGVATTHQRSPVAVYTAGELNGKQITDLSVGSYSACVLADGVPYCWGDATYGRIGNGGSTTGVRAAPTAVVTSGVLAGKTITKLASGVYDNCALASGAVHCWGRVVATTRSSPVAFAQDGSLTSKTVTSITTSNSNVGHCAVAEGQVHCVGTNTVGQLGNGTTTTSSVPVQAGTTGDMSGKTIQELVTLGGTNHCAIDTARALYCWGAGGNGVLGNGATANVLVPTKITNSALSAGSLQIASGNSATMCVIVSGAPYCWGSGSYGILGNGGTADSLLPATVSW